MKVIRDPEEVEPVAMSVDAVARMFGCSRDTVIGMIGVQIEGFKSQPGKGGRWFVWKDSVDALRERSRIQPAQDAA